MPDPSLSLRKGAIVPWARTGNTSPYYTQTLEALAKHYKVSMNTPWRELPERVAERHPLRHRLGSGHLRL